MDKNNVKLLIIVIIIITAIAGIFVSEYVKNKSSGPNPQISVQINKDNDLKKDNKFEIFDKWTLVSRENFWDNPKIFANRNYNFPNIKFSYPDNWEFQCCNDMDYASTHIIYSSKDRNKSLPYIRITDYVLSGCLNSQSDCSLGEIAKITADEKFNQLTSVIPARDVLPKAKLNNLNTTAFVYKKSEENNKVSKGYLINLKNDVIGIDFIDYELLENTFIEKFLNQISFEGK